MTFQELADSPASHVERARVERLRQAASNGGEGLAELLAMRASASWSVRREVIAALGGLGDVALVPLCDSLVHERSDETVIAATVDALVASTGNADASVRALSYENDPAVVADVAQILGRRRSRESLTVLGELSQHENDNVAVAAIEALGRVGGRSVVDLLVTAVESRRFFRTFAAIDVLAKSGDPRAIAPLVALIDSAHYSFEAARALGRTADRAAVPALSRLLSSPVDGQVRVAALALHELRQGYGERFGTTAPIEDALRKATPRGALRRLLQCYGGGDGHEQIAVLVLLGCLRTDEAIPVLLGALDGSAQLAKTAAEVLSWLATDTSVELIAALRSGTSAHRQVLLGTISETRAVPGVLECLKDADAGVRRLACESLARIGSVTAVPALFGMLEDQSSAVVQAATAAIISLGGDGTLELAIRAARSRLAGERRAAIRILSCIGHSEAEPVILAATLDTDARVRDTAIHGLALRESPECRGRLLELATNAEPAVRASALRALGDTSSEPRVVAALLGGLSDSDPWARYFACQSLGKTRAESSVHAISALVGDGAGQVRMAAIEALSHLPGAESFAALVAAAGSPELDLRRAALIGLGLSKRPEAVPILISHTESNDEATRLITLSALANFETPETLTALSAAARDPSDALRTAAVGLLAQIPAVDGTRVLGALLDEPVSRELVRDALCVPHPYRVAGISSVLRHADDELALELTRILARLKGPEATAALFEALTFPSGSARKAAATTLGAVGSREAFAALQRLAVTDPDSEVRRVAALLMAE